MKILILVVLLNFSWIKAIHDLTLVHGPNTPVYLVQYKDDYIKVIVEKNLLPSFRTKYSEQEAIQPNMLLVYDYWDFEKYGKERCLDRAKKTIKHINSYFDKLNSHPKIEVILSGIVLITDRRAYPKPYTFQVPEKDFMASNLLTEKYIIEAEGNSGDYRDFTIATAELQRFSKWLNDYQDQFESLDYNFFLYSFPWYMADDASPDIEKHLIMGISKDSLCNSQPGILINNLIGDEHHAYPLEISYLFGISHPHDRSDHHHYTSTYDFYDDERNKWLNHLTNVISRNTRNNSYYCVKQKELDYDD